MTAAARIVHGDAAPGADPAPVVDGDVVSASEEARVVVAEDQVPLRRALVELIDGAADLRVAADVGTGDAAVSAAGRLLPDLVLMDIRMPGTDGLVATATICTTRPATKVVILTTFGLDEYVYEALRAGASGFLLKTARPEEVLRALRAAHDGDAVLSPEVTGQVIAGFAGGAPHPAVAERSPFDALSDRELEVVDAVAAGLSNEEIAADLHLSLATVKTYLSRLYLRLGVRDRTQLVILAYESGHLARRR